MENKKINFIDLVYLICYSFYKRYEKSLTELSGQILTSVCLNLNLIILLVILNELFNVEVFENKWNVIYIIIPVMLIVFIRYNNYKKIQQIEEVFRSFDSRKRSLLSLSISLYILLSIFGSLIFLVVMGELNNPPAFWDR